ncbi:MAM and LDL-receptor class A domain-containing protein 1-like [Teleopsis dalmanni]|uniref:MAM and LDL-receptor class A domain-containing protein 1-like n=1 Tax=Teleopsis dalmanni TaxID=139649 RepID=UPI0018CDB49C|nr:MAM and LDL-receptor class A domain-containing protein 1-like [Teleopsis dalmanni]
MVITEKINWLCVSLMASLIFTCSLAVRNSNHRVDCNPPDAIPNGTFKMRRNNMLMRINCNTGYWLNGNRIIDCKNGKWYGEKSVCAKKGCNTDFQKPENGNIQIISEYKAMLFCNQNYVLTGSRLAFCNGTHWDRQIGECKKKKSSSNLYCDFEPEDSCGWAHQLGTIYYWKRVMAANLFKSYHTGPLHDHTTRNAYGGHYMLMEDWGTGQGETMKLISPIYSLELTVDHNCCFQFYYFMYGVGVGTLFVYIMPVTANLGELETNDKIYRAFKISGQQNNIWNEAHFKVPKMSEDFQIIFVATEGISHFSDIAIDDVRLFADRNCTGLQNISNEEIGSKYLTEESINSYESCESRCNEKHLTNGVVRNNRELVMLCNCHSECQIEDSCCLDYTTFCLDEFLT